MKQTTLCILLKDDQVLLGLKKRGFGMGKWNGVGGKQQDGETIEEAAVRETKEEIGVDVALEDLERMAFMEFRFKDNPDWNLDCTIFTVRRWQGEPVESEEMLPQWYSKYALPFEKMWADDRHWFGSVLTGKKMRGEFLFNNDGSVILEHRLSEDLP